MTSPLRTGVLLAPFVGIFLVFFIAWAGQAPAVAAVAEEARVWVGGVMGWVFIGAAPAVLALMLIAYIALGGIRIGGPVARPNFGTFTAIAIGVAASTSLGLLFWASAEPVFHAHRPPASLDIEPMTRDARVFAQAATFFHWSVVNHALNALFMVGFGIAAQNLARRPSVDELILGSPGAGEPARPTAAILDGIPVFFVTLTMAAALASCILALSGELTRFGPYAPNAAALFVIAAAVAFMIFIAGAKPVRSVYAGLAMFSLVLMMLLMISATVLGPAGDILSGGVKALWAMIRSIPLFSTFTGYASADPWPQTWPMTHWASWMILAPLTGLFLSRAARGFRIADAIFLFAFIPALVSMLWVMVFGGLALSIDEETRGGIWTAIQRGGADDASYAALWTLPAGEALVMGFVVLVVLCFASFAAAILHAVMLVCAPGDHTLSEVRTARGTAAVIWCAALGVAGWALASSGQSGVIDAVARIGGAPALVITIGAALAVLRFCIMPLGLHGSVPRKPVQIDFDLRDAVSQDFDRDMDEDPPLRRNTRRKKSA